MSEIMDLRNLAGVKIETPPMANDDLMAKAQDLMADIVNRNEVEDQFEGLALSVIREAGSGRILSAILTPVDMIDGEASLRYQVPISEQEVSNH